MKIRLAGCVIENSEKKILLLHRNTPKRVQWETPGGKIEGGEDSERTAVREVKEELGVQVKILKKLGQKSFKEDDFEMDYIWYKAKIISGEPKVMEDSFDNLKYFSWSELKKREDLSANTQNLVNAYFAGEINL